MAKAARPSQKPSLSRLLTDGCAWIANLHKSCRNTCFEIKVSKPLIQP
jgi:hypothetical protein